jgi:regulator of replication initiation timing
VAEATSRSNPIVEKQAAEILELKSQLELARSTLSKSVSETRAVMENLQARNAELTRELESARARLSRIEIPLDSPSASELPTLEEWQDTLRQLSHFQQLAGDDNFAQNLLSQIQTLEAQKCDAEAELTRIRTALNFRPSPEASSTAPSVTSSFRRFANTVSVHGQTLSRRSSVAEHFLDLSSGPLQAKRSAKPKNKRSDQCIQQ